MWPRLPGAARLTQRLRRAGVFAARPDLSREILIYQMGKVGSTAIVASLAARGVPAIQSHFVDSETFRRAVDRFANPGLQPAAARESLGQLNSNLLLRYQIGQALRAGARSATGPLRLLTLVREPLDWYFSSLSQDFSLIEGRLAHWLRQQGHHSHEIDADGLLKMLQQVVELYLQLIPDMSSDHAAVLRQTDGTATQSFLLGEVARLLRPHFWFQRHFQPVFDIDVFALPFDPTSGHGEYADDNLRILLLRYEDLAGNTGRIAGLAGLETLPLLRRNDSADKAQTALLQAARRQLDLPVEFLSRYYQSDYCRRFYPGAGAPNDADQNSDALSSSTAASMSGSSDRA